MEKNCGNCKNWVPYEQAGARYCNVTECARTLCDMSCPRHAAKEPEIPAVLKDWKPVWHQGQPPAEETKKGVDGKRRYLVASDIGGYYAVVLWYMDKLVISWNRTPFGIIAFYAELP